MYGFLQNRLKLDGNKFFEKALCEQGAAETNQIFTFSIDGVGQSFSEKNECCFLRQIN